MGQAKLGGNMTALLLLPSVNTRRCAPANATVSSLYCCQQQKTALHTWHYYLRNRNRLDIGDLYEDTVWPLINCSRCPDRDTAIPAWSVIVKILKAEVAVLIDYIKHFDLAGRRSDYDYIHAQREGEQDEISGTGL